MKLKTRSRLLLAGSLVVVAVSGILVVRTALRTRASVERLETLDRLVEGLFHLQGISSSYADSPGERARTQWHAVHDELSRRLDEARAGGVHANPEELTRLTENLESVGVLFRQLEETEGAAADDADGSVAHLRSVLVSQLTITQQAMVADLNRWYGRVYDAMGAGSSRLAYASFVVLLALAGLLGGAALLIERGMIGPILDLQNGMAHVATGELGFRFRSERADELGAVARSFDEMTGRLEEQVARQRETSDELRAAQERLRILQHVSATANEAERLTHALEVLVEELTGMLGWDVGHAVVPDKARLGALDVWHPENPTRFGGLRRASEEVELASGEDLAASAFRSGAVEYRTGLSGDGDGGRGDDDRPRVERGLAIPVSADEEVVAVLQLFSTRDGPVDDELLRLAGDIATQLGRLAERERLEANFIQAQKMEAVGRLSAGVAHDFNNLLTVIRARTDFLRMELEDADGAADEIEGIQSAADKASRLTNQLLAFSRVQVLRPQILDPNDAVESITSLASRVLGEDVRTVTELAADLPAIKVDPGQLEQVLLNLAVNARDAMPEGGTLTLATAPEEIDPGELADRLGLDPGAYVRLSVADTGVGMDEEVQAKIFEPFFTTKGRDEGTGLGLATAYGIMSQSGGAIDVESAPGEGTTFILRFPAVNEAPVAVERPAAAADDEKVTGRVLVIEDDESVRRVTRMILERRGFQVQAVGDAESGLRALRAEDHGVDVVLTDLVLPEMSGRALLDRLREGAPELSLIAMSGYAEGSPGRRGDLPMDVHFVQKPFTPDGLVEVVREALLGGSG